MKMKKILLLGVFLLAMIPGKAQVSMNDAKALYIYNFLKHIKWPENSVGDKYVIGVVGNSSTFNALKSLTTNRRVGTKPIEVVRFKSAKEITDCQVLFISDERKSEIQTITNQFAGKSCLVIGEASGTTDIGACIDFRVVDNKLKFAINEENTKRQQLIVSRSLIDMAI